MRLPARLRTAFAALSADSTATPPRGVETCAVLAGREEAPAAASAGGFAVTHLILPQQSGGADACEMSPAGEDAVLAECLSAGVVTLGWIHSHPSQTAFLSAPDQHTHAGYQSLLPEAVAVVLAPRDAATACAAGCAAFSLSEAGLALVLRCERRGHHPHNDAPGEEAYGPARHVEWLAAAPLTVVDLRGAARAQFKMA